jgi:hypothetical protein
MLTGWASTDSSLRLDPLGGNVCLKRLGLSGVITMKMINITRSTSISGVTLIYGIALASVALPSHS